MTEQEIKPYYHKAQYYETDQMGIIHNSNYLRWFEECRTDYMDQIGLPYDAMEKAGIISVVLVSHCEYKHPLHYEETAEIRAEIVHFNGYKMTVGYIVKNAETGTVCATGYTQHGMLSKDLSKPVHLEKTFPLAYQILSRSLQNAIRKRGIKD